MKFDKVVMWEMNYYLPSNCYPNKTSKHGQNLTIFYEEVALDKIHQFVTSSCNLGEN